MKNLFTTAFLLLALWGKSQTEFGSLVSFPDYNHTSQDMISIVNQLNVKCIRQAIIMTEWDGTSTRFDQFTAAGLKVIMNINWGNPAVAPIPFPTDTVAYKQQLSAILAIHNPEVVVIENEELTAQYHTGPLTDYINELRAAIGVCHSKGLKVANAGLLTTPLCILVYNDLISRGLTEDAEDFENRTFNPQMTAYVANPDGDFGLGDKVANCAMLVSAYAGLDLDYVNFHLAEPVNASDFGDGNSATPKIYGEIMDYLTRSTGKPTMTNETAQKNLSPTLVTSMLEAYKEEGIKYAIWYSGDDTGMNWGDSALHNVDGTLRLSGVAFSNFMSNKSQDLTRPVYIPLLFLNLIQFV